ncbi:unnamed protein product, partial [Ectocarpus sp. 6 AP-2014]
EQNQNLSKAEDNTWQSMSGRACSVRVGTAETQDCQTCGAGAALVIACRERRDDKTDQSERRIKTAYHHHRAQSYKVSNSYAERERERAKPHARPSPPIFLPFQ